MSLGDLAATLRKIAYGQPLSADEAFVAMSTINDEDEIGNLQSSDGMYFLALTFGIMAKGPTADELHGFVRHIEERSPRLRADVAPGRLLDVSGSGGDKIKTFNVGTTATFIAAGGGAIVAKQATRGYTGLTGSADIFQRLGMNPFAVESKNVTRCLERVGVSAFYTPALGRGFKNRVDFLTKLKNIGLTYPTPWHLVSWVYSPFQLGARLYGVFDERYVDVVSELFARLGYERSMVVCGIDGLDEISVVGDTVVSERRDGESKRYVITPEDLGIPRASVEDIAAISADEERALVSPEAPDSDKAHVRERITRRNIGDFIRIVYGVESGPKATLAIVNAGAALYLAGVSDSVKAGVDAARASITEGRASAKLEAFVREAGDQAMLRQLKQEYL